MFRGDRRTEGVNWGNLAVVYKNQGCRSSSSRVSENIDDFSKIGDKRNESVVQNNMGIIYKSLGDMKSPLRATPIRYESLKKLKILQVRRRVM